MFYPHGESKGKWTWFTHPVLNLPNTKSILVPILNGKCC